MIPEIQNSSPATEESCVKLPKVLGFDSELANFILGRRQHRAGTGREASRALLRAIDGLPRRSSYPTSCTCGALRGEAGGGRESREDRTASGEYEKPAAAACTCGYDPQDWGRKFLPENGGCFYVDLDHLEVCCPEVLSAFDHVASWHAMLRLARRALQAANAALPPGERIVVLANNSDGQGQSYGSHLSLLVGRRAFSNIHHRRPHHLLYLASYLTSSIVFTGAGKVGSENRRPAVDYQISQRADFFETVSGLQTTFDRPIVNSRDESHALGGMARLHLILFDNTLCHVASLLKAGVTQLILAMIEEERVATDVLLEDPLDALAAWTRDVSLKAAARLANGGRSTAVDLQRRFLDHAAAFVAAGRAEGVVPRAGEVLAVWDDTLARLLADRDSLAARLDWVLKLSILERARARKGLDWTAPGLKHLDHLYSSLDPDEGLYWAYERRGLVERMVTEEEMERFTREPPADTRAWGRAHLLRRAGPLRVADCDWGWMRIRTRDDSRSYVSRRIDLEDPLGHTQERLAPCLEAAGDLDEVIDVLDPFGDLRKETHDEIPPPTGRTDRIHEMPGRLRN
jgi:proteasome accessory factor A